MTKPELESLSWHPELSDKTEPADGSARSAAGNPGPGLVDPAPSVLQQRLGSSDSSHDSVPGLLICSALPHADEQGDLRARFDQHYFTEAKAFMLACFPNEEAWQQWTEEIGGKIAEDLYIVSFENNREPPYSTDQFLRAAEAYYRYGLTAKSIQENYPDVRVCSVIPLIRDLAVLTNPSLARTFGYTGESCQRAAKRIVGEEPRTAQQFAYQWLYTDVPQLSDPNSTLFAEWKRALRELRNPLTTGGRFYHVHEDDAVRLVQMICQSGYSWKLAVSLIGNRELTANNAPDVTFISLYLLKKILPEYTTGVQRTIPVLGGRNHAQYMNSAEKKYALYIERKEIQEIVEENITRYRSNRSQEPPYFNPLQLFVLSEYAEGKEIDEIGRSLSDIGIPYLDKIDRAVTNLRNLAKGKPVNGEMSLRSEFLDVVFFSLLGNVGALERLHRFTRGKSLPRSFYEKAEEIISSAATAVRREGSTRTISPDEIRRIVESRIKRISIIDTAREMEIGRNVSLELLRYLEQAVIAECFPPLLHSYSALFSQGRTSQEYFLSHQHIFSLPPHPDFTSEEHEAWTIAKQRANGVTAEEIIQQGYTEQKVSVLSNLAILASLRYPITEGKGVIFSNQEFGVNQQGYPVMLDFDNGCAFVNGQDMGLSQREFGLLAMILNEKGEVSIAEAYSRLWPESEYNGADWQKDDIRSILIFLHQRLGQDTREEPLMFFHNHEGRIRYNPERWRDMPGTLHLYYRYSPFGVVEDMKIEDGVLKLVYVDSHERHISMGNDELRVLQILFEQQTGDWSTVEGIASTIAGGHFRPAAVYKVTNAITKLRRKLCIPYPKPGHILADYHGHFRIISSSDMVIERHPFSTSQGNWIFCPAHFALYDEETETFVTRLTVAEARALHAMLRGSTIIPIQSKSYLRKRLISAGIISEDDPAYRWELPAVFQRDTFQDEQSDAFDWRGKLSVTQTPDGENILNVFLDEGSEHSFLIYHEEMHLSEEDPMDPLKFSDPERINDPLFASSVDGDDSDPTDFRTRARIEANEYPVLSRSGEMILLLRMKAGDPVARERLFRSNMLLAYDIAYQVCFLQGKWDDFPDMLQEGYTGIEKAIARFDISRKGVDGRLGRFSTYATWWIRSKVKRYLANQGGTIRIPVHAGDKFETIYRARKEFIKIEGRTPTNEELAFAIWKEEYRTKVMQMGLGCTQIIGNRDVPGGMRLSFRSKLDWVTIAFQHSEMTSLDELIGEDEDGDPYEVVPDGIESIEDAVLTELADHFRNDELYDAMELLPDRLRKILLYRYGFTDDTFHTLEETGDEFGLTHERIRQLQKQALNLLRACLPQR